MAAGVGTLWSLNIKINSERKGFNEKFWLAEKTEAEAKTAALAICAQRKKLLPSNASIFFATISKNDTNRDSRFLSTALGDGSYVSAGVDPDPSVYDYANTALLVRCENTNGTSITRKFVCIPDEIVTDGALVSSITPITSTPVAEPAADAVDATWYAKFNRMLGLLAFYTSHVQGGHLPGGPYTYFAFNAMYAMRIGQKKGARVFA